MADVIFNNARARLRQQLLDGADLIVVLLKAAEADATLRDYDDLAALLAEVGNEEADFTSYERKVIANANVTATVDNNDNVLDVSIGNQTWTSAGGAENNSLVKLMVCIDGASDSDRIPVSAADWTLTTDGSDITATEHSDGFYRSA